MFYILESVCSDYALASILIILKRILSFIQIFVPIILIISVVVQLIKKVLNPEEGGREGSMKTIINSFMAALIVVFLPYIVNLTMSTISAYGDVGLSENGTLSVLNVTSCWQQAETKTAVLDSSMQSSSSTIDQERSQNAVSLYDNSSDYEQLVKFYEENKKNGNNSSLGSSTSINGAIVYETPSVGMKVPVMYQGDYSTVSLCDANVASNGCGWTSAAMVVSYLKGEIVSPTDIVSWSDKNYCTSVGGMSWKLPAAVSEHYGLEKPIQTTDINKVVEALKNNQVVMSSQRAGLFTSGSHVIVLRGYSNDRIYVNDPNTANSVGKGYLNRGFTVSEINDSNDMYFIFGQKLSN